jgi:hypothetical protein
MLLLVKPMSPVVDQRDRAVYIESRKTGTVPRA